MTVAQVAAQTPELVVLLHGLSRTGLSLWRLAHALRRAGYRTLIWRYPSRRHEFGELQRRFRRFLAQLDGETAPVHFVGHSLGALLIRAGLADPVHFRVGRIVMLAPPNRGAGIVTKISRIPGLPRLFGKPAADLAAGAAWLARLGVPRAEIGVIAGTRALHPLNPSSWLNAILRTAKPHDGTVELDSTRLPGMLDFVPVDATHTFICDHPDAIRQTMQFLTHGRFDHGHGAN